MNRRDTVFALLALGASPLAARAQDAGKVWRIGYLGLQSGTGENEVAFLEGLLSLGYVEGRNLSIEYRWAAGKEDRLPELAAQLVRLKVDAIVTVATTASAVAKRATGTIPIVFAMAGDPVGTGLVASLARPGGNVTGSSAQTTEFTGKELQLMRELLPKATRIAVLAYKGGLLAPLFLEQVRAAAKTTGITLIVQEVGEAGALAGAFSAMARERAQALLVQVTPFSVQHRSRIIELAGQHRLPTMFRGAADAGGLMSYGPSNRELSRRAAYFVDRIFKGAKPADLPVEQPTKFELVINLKTAKALGLKIPQALLIRADAVIE
ncbi:MAG: ABC transporter substrate-binding protein [Betaproteobacteria bacterium]|nr:ABC transporter substrate-binding protein [Betaproteobacteria bacterium]